MCLSFNDFVAEVTEKISEYLPDRLKDAIIRVSEVKRNNVTLTGLCIMQKDMALSPFISLDDFYLAYCDGDSMDEVLKKISEFRIMAEPHFEFDLDEVLDFNKIKEKIRVRIIGKNNHNIQFLEGKPFDTYLADDLLIYYVVEFETDGEMYSVAVTKELMRNWKIDDYELRAVAHENEIMQHYKIFSFADMVRERRLNKFAHDDLTADSDFAELVDASEKVDLLILTTSGNYGSSAVLHHDALLELREKMGDFWLIPSSIYEWIAVPAFSMAIDVAQEMVKKVNDSEVQKQERLSYSVYEYDFVTKKLKIVE